MLNLLLTLSMTASPQAKPATNTKCPVLGGKVTEKSKTVAVRGQEYRLCCGGCDTTLLKNPDKYLEKDGTPRNAKK
jgi:YHS domain-containing protein